MSDWVMPKGTLGNGFAITLTPQRAGWKYSGLHVLELAPGQPQVIELGPSEAAVLPLSARNLQVTVGEEVFALEGRGGVFADITDWVYAPTGSSVTVLAPQGGEVAIATTLAEEVHPATHIPKSAVEVVVRGAGNATRQVTNYAAPNVFDSAHRLLVCEILTPGGNWSSYPPHRHDGIGDCPFNNEEIYYFRIGREGSAHGDPTGIGFHGTYTAPEDSGSPVRFETTVRDGDVAIVPRGYHGPCVAGPGYPMYYLNILAGPGERSFGFCDDPSHHWVRDTWLNMEQDPRVPLTGSVTTGSAK